MKTINNDIIKAASIASKSTARPVLACVNVSNDYFEASDSFRAIRIKRK